MQKIILLISLALLLAIAGQACAPEPGPQHFPVLKEPPPRIQSGYFTVYNRLNGLPCNEIRSILLLDENLVIVGTRDNGLIIHDGEKWHVSGDGLFEFPAVTVTTMAKVNSTTLLAGTAEGIFRGVLSGNRFSFTRIGTHNGENLNVSAIAPAQDGSDSFLAACDRMAGILENESFIPFHVPAHFSPTGFSAVTGFISQSYAGCNGGLYKVSGSSLVPFFAGKDPTGWINAFATARDRLYIASSNGVFIMDAKEEFDTLLPGVWASCLAFSAFPEDSLSGDGRRAFIAEGETGQLVSDTDTFAGLRAQYTQLQQDYTAYTRRYAGEAQADPDAVSAMYQRFFDFQLQVEETIRKAETMGRIRAPLLTGLWVGTQDQGLILFATDGKRYHLTSANSKLVSDNITAIASRENGETWIGTADGGLMRYTSRPSGKKGNLKKLIKCRPTRIRVISDLLLVGTENEGLHIFDAKTLQSLGNFQAENTPGFHTLVTDFAGDREGNIWVTGNAGVFQWNGKTWKRIEFLQEKTSPTTPATRITIDHANRVFVAFEQRAKASQQIFFFNGRKLVNTDPPAILHIRQLSGADRLEAIKEHSLAETYMRSFDFANASAALQSFDPGDESKVTALLNTEHYLLIGLDSGLQKIFDGESFKQLSELGTGKIGPIGNFFRLPSGIIVIQGQEGICEFDGQKYRLLESAATGLGFAINDMCPDQLNPETFRIAFKSSEGGGYARYQEPFWEKLYTDVPIISIAQAELAIFLATADGVDYLYE